MIFFTHLAWKSKQIWFPSFRVAMTSILTQCGPCGMSSMLAICLLEKGLDWVFMHWQRSSALLIVAPCERAAAAASSSRIARQLFMVTC